MQVSSKPGIMKYEVARVVLLDLGPIFCQVHVALALVILAEHRPIEDTWPSRVQCVEHLIRSKRRQIHLDSNTTM